MDKKDKIGAAWKKVSKKGVKFLSGEIEINGFKTPIVMFVNSYKEENSKQPDFIIYKSERSETHEEDVF
ncbi:MAG: DUF736 domain-containing protein [Magnetococcus sp. WYHC-3]